MATLTLISIIFVILQVIKSARESNPTVLLGIELAKTSYSTSKSSTESVVLDSLRNVSISNEIHVCHQFRLILFARPNDRFWDYWMG